jgi:hypothetical protein
MKEELIGMGEAAIRLQVSEARVARELLRREGVELIAVSARAYVVAAADVERLIQKRRADSPDGSGKIGRGRPRKQVIA